LGSHLQMPAQIMHGCSWQPTISLICEGSASIPKLLTQLSSVFLFFLWQPTWLGARMMPGGRLKGSRASAGQYESCLRTSLAHTSSPYCGAAHTHRQQACVCFRRLLSLKDQNCISDHLLRNGHLLGKWVQANLGELEHKEAHQMRALAKTVNSKADELCKQRAQCN